MTNGSPAIAPRTSVAWGSGAPIPGTPFREVIATAETDGRLVALAVDMPAGEVVPEHVHDGEDQIIVVISGAVVATVGTDELLLTAGGVAYLPRGIPHSLRNAGDEPARLLDLYTPGGFERVLAAMAPGADDPTGATTPS